MARWVYCRMCGCTGMHRDPATNLEYPCQNGCDGGRVYETANPEWFRMLVECGAEVFEGQGQAGPVRYSAASESPGHPRSACPA